ncbi:DNA repair protein complementing XP-C cells homolog isoform X2 [Bombus terrestris]|uniref:DNA repair protein complementing XP-C cells homolog isoform X2 n=1 Tax=Bombus terrestris TaxID=30195 RepID=A0A9C6SHT5_BOMTE|nr:DNA repair protein complementing XP-C cells homolog isoform X2 [Bombus terrestris]
MNCLSEDDSSDSSNEFLVDPRKINLNSSFFAKKKPDAAAVEDRIDTEDESTDDEDLEDVSQTDNIELFTQVLKNLEYSQKFKQNDDNIEKKESHSDHSILQEKEEKALKVKKEVKDTTSSNEINELLLQGECSIGSLSKKGSEDAIIKNEEDTEPPNEYTIPKDGVKIVLPGTCLMINRKKKGKPDLRAILKKRLRDAQILVEKVGLLCWLAYGFRLNGQINQPEIMAGVLSLISTSNYPKDRIDLIYLEKFTKWFMHVFTFEPVESNGNKQIDKETLLKILKDKKVSNYKELILLYIATLRALGLNCRLVISLCPPHRIYNNNPLFKLDKEPEPVGKDKSNVTKKRSSKKKEEKEITSDKTNVIQNSSEAKKNANAEAKKRAVKILHSKLQTCKGKNKSDTSKDSNSEGKVTKKSNTKSTEKKDESGSAEQEKSMSSLRQLRSRKVNINSEDNKARKSTDLSSKVDGTKSKYYIEEDSTDSEAEFQPKPKLSVRKSNDKEEALQSSKNTIKKNRKLVSSDSEDQTNKTKKRQDIWAEIYLESEESWICTSVLDEKIHCIPEIYKKATKPVLYVVAWNSEGLVKDVTRRYCAQWLTVTRKQRVDEKWWLETLSYWKEKNTAISRAEDEMLLQKELEQPLPRTLSEIKGHPLYVIQRHLLKFEALYPPDCVPLGHTSTGEPIYSRHCVHTIRSRETWLKEARVVKPNQEAYKIVKARPKYDKLSGMKIKDSPLELFGEWQTMEYEPPVAKDGIVPRNEYGNVDLFKQRMLPKGTVHINLPGLNRIARKLNIDCAPAVVGFNFGSMGAVPALEGYVVCSEYEDTLREAWEAEQVEAIKRTKEKQEKRVYRNWKRLIQGLLIRE